MAVARKHPQYKTRSPAALRRILRYSTLYRSVRVAVADQSAYEAFYMNKLAELPGLARLNSQFTMKMVKRAAGLAL